MTEITNRKRYPVQLVVRSRKHPRSFTTLHVAGIGSGQNTVLIEDERLTEYVDRLEKWELISTKQVSNKMK